MKKVILLVRVSTEQQSYNEQANDLIRKAKELGYNDSDMIIIAEKESGIKLKESERKGINEMKSHIEEGGVDRVLIWELSRLSRRTTDLYNIKDYLQEKQVQLTCLKPEFNLFQDDFKVNDMANIVFSLFSTIAENEMIVKKERFHRSKVRNAEQGRFSGGVPKFGYTVDDNGVYIIDGWNIVDRKYAPSHEQDSHDLEEMLQHINSKQPESMRLSDDEISQAVARAGASVELDKFFTSLEVNDNG